VSREGLLSLIPHLIKQLLRVRVVGVGVAGWNIALKVRSARECELGTLLGPEETPACRVFLVAILGLAGLTRWGFCGVVVGVGFGVWLCVECCIVDASILLWSSV
jgi:hypothetical protein